jgi:hypothetical protein
MRLFIFFFVFLSCAAQCMDFSHEEKQTQKGNSKNKTIAQFYRSLNGTLEAKLLYYYKINSAITYESVCKYIMPLSSMDLDLPKEYLAAEKIRVCIPIIQQLRENKHGADFADPAELLITQTGATIDNFDSYDDEYRALFDIHLQISYVPISKNYIQNVHTCLAELNLERYLIYFIDYKESSIKLEKKFIKFHEKYSFFINLLASANKMPLINHELYIYFLEEISNLNELVWNHSETSKKIFKRIKKEDWDKITKWQLYNERILPVLFVSLETYPVMASNEAKEI